MSLQSSIALRRLSVASFSPRICAAEAVIRLWISSIASCGVRPEDIAFIPVLQREAKVVVYGPLASIPVPPDVVLLFVKAEQSLILSEASQQLENGLPPALGRPACGIVPHALNTGRTALSLGCCGARTYLDVLTPEVALYAVPGSKLGAFTERVAALANANTVLTRFHSLRRKEIEAGKHPSVKESLHAMQ